MSESIRGLEQLDALIGKVDKLTEEFGNGLKKRVEGYTPVKTGLLKNSWILTFDTANKEILLSNDAKTKGGDLYMVYVDQGTDKFPGFFMIERTMMDSESILAAAMSKVGL